MTRVPGLTSCGRWWLHLAHCFHVSSATALVQANVMGTAADSTDWIDETSLQQASALIHDHNIAIQKLQEHLRKWSRDMAIVKGTSEETSVMQTMQS